MSLPNPIAVSLVMPTYNEAGHIKGLIEDCAMVLESTTSDYEIIVMDDDSADQTWKLAGEIAETNRRVRVVRRMSGHGLTASIQEGIDQARNAVVIWMDCDYSHPPEKIPQLLYMIEQGFDAVINSRYVIGGGEDRKGKGSAIQLFLSLTLNWSIRFLLRSDLADYTSGFIAVRRSVLQTLRLRGDYGEYFIDFVYRMMKANYRICELPYMSVPRKSGESKTGTNIGDYTRRGVKYLATVMKLKWEDATGKG